MARGLKTVWPPLVFSLPHHRTHELGPDEYVPPIRDKTEGSQWLGDVGPADDMLVRITREATEDSVDGISLSDFKVGRVYSLPVPLATLMIAEAWAVPVSESESNAITLPEITFQAFPRRERRRRILSNRRLCLELGIAADRRRKPKS